METFLPRGRLTTACLAAAHGEQGKKIGQKIDEWLATGKLKKLDKIQASPEATAIQLIAGVVGFGPAAAHRLVQKGVTSLEGEGSLLADVNRAC